MFPVVIHIDKSVEKPQEEGSKILDYLSEADFIEELDISDVFLSHSFIASKPSDTYSHTLSCHGLKPYY